MKKKKSAGEVRKGKTKESNKETFVSSCTIDMRTRYSEKALLPDVLFNGKYERNVLYKLTTGELVRYEHLGIYNNNSGQCADDLENISQELYNMPFSVVEKQWKLRIGELNGVWHKVRMIK